VYEFPSVENASPEGVVGTGADLDPGTLLAAYRSGIFPMPVDGELVWWSPDPRAILPLDRFHPSTSLRKSIRRYEITVNRQFEQVVRACADPARDHGWISDESVHAYCHLQELGWAHSIETWQHGKLVGGLYGVSIGGLFAGESMFHRARDASKVALARLVEVMGEWDHPLLDVQWMTPHLESLGVVEVDRQDYLSRLRSSLQQEKGPPGGGPSHQSGVLGD
jgi:leucyl/phenylalanyl-tRNA--protein transferase